MKISVVTAVYNGAAFIQEAVESVLAQTLSSFEYIIVNDGSTDQTRDILERVTDPRVKIVHLQENQGAAKSLRFGIEQAGGNLIAIQDADDCSHPERLEKQKAFLEKNQEVGLVGTYIQCIYQENFLKKRARATEKLINSSQSQDFYGSAFCHGTFMFRKELYQKAGGYSEKYQIAYDYDLLQKFKEAAKIHKIPDVLYQYRLHPLSLSNQNLLKTNRESIEISVKGIIHATGCQKVYLVVGTKDACQFFKQQIEPELSGRFEYAAPIINDGFKDFQIIMLDFHGSAHFIKELRAKGLPFFKVWCVVH